MGRANFGGAQDLSGTFAYLYNQYIGDQRSLALRSEQRAKQAQTAADNDVIDQWKNGELTDEEFRAYAEDRVEASAGLDPEMVTYWSGVIRDLDTNILTESISLQAEELMDRIQEGTATWDDLLTFYNAQRDLLNESHPLYDELTERMNEVGDQVRQSRINGEFEKVTYDFQNNGITGAQAGAQIRALAEKYYKVNDPENYYKLLQYATQLEQYGANLYGAGRGGSGGGSGGGSSTKALNAAVDMALAGRDFWQSLGNQAKSGLDTGTWSYVDENGQVREAEYDLRDAAGDLLPGIADALAIGLSDAWDSVIVAYTAKGDMSAAANAAQGKQTDITNIIQPLNTEAPAQTMNLAMRGVVDAIVAAADSVDPVGAWQTQVVPIIEEFFKTASAVTRDVVATHTQTARDTITVPGEPDAEGNATVQTLNLGELFDAQMRSDNPELNTLFLNPAVVSALSDEQRATADFISQLKAMMQTAGLLGEGGAVDEATLEALLETFMPAGAADLANTLSAATTIVAEVANGTRVPVLVAGPNGAELQWLKQTTTGRPGYDENGRLRSVPTSVILTEDGRALEQSSLSTVLYQIGNQAFPVAAEAATTYQWLDVSTGEWKEMSAEDYEKNQTAAVGTKVPTKANAVIYGPDGHWWIQDGDSGQWWRDQIRVNGDGVPIGGLPAPYLGNDPRMAQRAAAGAVKTNPDGTVVPLDPLGGVTENGVAVGSYYTRGQAAQSAHSTLEGDPVDDYWYQRTTRAARRQELALRRQAIQVPQGVDPGRLSGGAGNLVDPLSNQLIARAQQLITSPVLSTSAQQREGGLPPPTLAPTAAIPTLVSGTFTPPTFTPPPVVQPTTYPSLTSNTLPTYTPPPRIAPGGTSRLGGALEGY